MQKVIHKYTARVPEEPHLPMELTLPDDHLIVHVADPAERGEALSFWALVDPDTDHITRNLLAIPTGEPVDYEEYVHMATVRTRGGRIVVHVMEHIDDVKFGNVDVEDEEDEILPVAEDKPKEEKGKASKKS